MEILVLVIYMSYPFGGISDMVVERCVVSCPAEASIKLWQQREYRTGGIENRSYRGELYRIDLSKKTVTKIELPEVKFEKEK